MSQITDNKIYYLFALESMDGLINGFNRFIDRFKSETEALDYYKNNLEYKENITYQNNKTLIDVVKCYIWNFNTGQLNLYFRHELKRHLTLGGIIQSQSAKSTELKIQETRKIKNGLNVKYWFYPVIMHGSHVATDGVLIGKNNLEDQLDTSFPDRLINKSYYKYTDGDYNDILRIDYYDMETHEVKTFITKETLESYASSQHYICVLDFEANCVESNDRSVNEIIEFPSVLYHWNLLENDFKEVSRYQDYVKPIKNPKLSKYCTDLTGITQEQVDNGISFPESFRGHYDWLKKNINPVLLDYCTTFVTCGNWDLETMLPKDCSRHGIIYYPDIYKRFINIKKSYQNTLNTPKQFGLANMLKLAKMNMEGRHHSGIDDCHNTGRLFHYLIKKGYQLNNQDVVYVKQKRNYKPQTYKNTIN